MSRLYETTGGWAVEDSEFARHLWQASSLETVFADIWLGPRRAVGTKCQHSALQVQLSCLVRWIDPCCW